MVLVVVMALVELMVTVPGGGWGRKHSLSSRKIQEFALD
jgi:hypothetical protein